MRKLTREAVDELMAKKNVVGVGYGKKVKDGKKTDIECVQVMVERKVPMSNLTAYDTVPKQIGKDGPVTDVIQIGTVKALALRTDRWRPAPGGVSIGHVDISAGTLGSLVWKDGKRYILSNNHVLANSNDAAIGDPILQPGPHDGGELGIDNIATLHDYIPINWAGGQEPNCGIAIVIEAILNGIARFIASDHRFVLVRGMDLTNRVDAALAEPYVLSEVTPDIIDIGPITGIRENIGIGTPTKKSGRTSETTTGEVISIGVTISVQYGGGKIGVFEGQTLTDMKSAGGDSGSLVVDTDNKAIGLLFAGSDEVTVFNPIAFVLDELGISFAA